VVSRDKGGNVSENAAKFGRNDSGASTSAMKDYNMPWHIKLLLTVAIVTLTADFIGRDLLSFYYNSTGVMEIDLGWLDFPFIMIDIFIILISTIAFAHHILLNIITFAHHSCIRIRFIHSMPMIIMIGTLAVGANLVLGMQFLKLYFFENTYKACAQTQIQKGLIVCSISGYSYHNVMIVYDANGELKDICGKPSNALENLALKEGLYQPGQGIFCSPLYGGYYYIENHYIGSLQG
jgi:hypothetical protein